MIYLDTSVLLAFVLAKERCPSNAFWDQELISSRLLVYETWSRLHGYSLAQSHGPSATALLDRITLLPLDERVLARALDPFPRPVRTLDALHLASLVHLRLAGIELELASYDDRLTDAATALGIALAEF